jgi:hypothetical protein
MHAWPLPSPSPSPSPSCCSPFNVFEQVDADDSVREPVERTVAQSSFFGGRQPCVATLRLTSAVIMPGCSLQVLLHVNNGTTRPVNGFVIQLMRRTVLRANQLVLGLETSRIARKDEVRADRAASSHAQRHLRHLWVR